MYDPLLHDGQGCPAVVSPDAPGTQELRDGVPRQLQPEHHLPGDQHRRPRGQLSGNQIVVAPYQGAIE